MGITFPLAPLTGTVRDFPTKSPPPAPVPKRTRPPPPRARGQSSAPGTLSEAQRQFAAQRHNLIFTFLKKKRLLIDDYYDIAAFGFLSAVQRYLTEPALRQYSFSTIAFRAMKRSIASFRRTEARRKESERRYLELSAGKETNLFEKLEAGLLLHDLAAISTREQYALASMRLQGYSIAETALAHGMSDSRVRRLLKEMYRVYLQLYKNI